MRIFAHQFDPKPKTSSPIVPPPLPRLQRKSTRPMIPPSIPISHPGDASEQEADAMADTIMRMPTPSTPTPLSPVQAPSIMGQYLGSSGQPLDASTRAHLEPRFGHDFGDVRVFSDAQANASAGSVNAQAYTVGRDIVFGADQYAPASTDGQALLAHELSHVVQQDRGAPLQRKQIQRAPLKTGQTNVVTVPPSPSKKISFDKRQCKYFSGDPVGLARTLLVKYLSEVANFAYPADFSWPDEVASGEYISANDKVSFCDLSTKVKGMDRDYTVDVYWPLAHGMLSSAFGFDAWISERSLSGNQFLWSYKLHCPPQPW